MKVFEGITKELDAKLFVRGGAEEGKGMEEVETTPIEGMKPGTSGLRKKVQHRFVLSAAQRCCR